MGKVGLAVMLLLVASAVGAQPPKFEIGANIGYTMSEGIEVDGINYDELDPESGLSYGFNVGFFASRLMEIGFLMSQQQSTLLGGGGLGGEDELIDLDVNNYHGYFAYNLGYNPAVVPYVMFGLGATQYVTGEFAGQEVDNETKFSSTWGGGVKIFPGGKLGARFAGRWTPTYIKTDAEGYWCDPYWGCTTYGDVDYSHQFEISAGAIYRY
jgi:opacity protein-like surface antigen